MDDIQKARLEELRVKDEADLTEEEKTELDELVALETPATPANEDQSSQ